ncbi:hypothetical protein U1872_08255 [Sphingomonas sp. RB3P16]|uniref:hypothetical protein n=1 Tax=Parasphingomonas frigoris TaxID=3096163 RepID=UPI002FC8E37C
MTLDYGIYDDDGTMIDTATVRCFRADDTSNRITGVVRVVSRDAPHDAARQLLARHIVHDLNNMLSPITMIVPLLIDKHKDEAERNSLHLILESARRAKQLLTEVRAQSRAEPPPLDPIHLDRLVHEAMPTLRASLPPAITIVAALDRVPAVQGNARHISEAVRAMVDGAARAIGQRRGAITIGTHCAPSGRTAAGSVKLFVRDDCASLAPAACDLAVAQAIATSHGGSISTRALPVGGIEIAILLPVPDSGGSQCLVA